MTSTTFINFASGLESKLDEVLFRANPYVYNPDDEQAHPYKKAADVVGGGVGIGALGYGGFKANSAILDRAKGLRSIDPGFAGKTRVGQYVGAAKDIGSDALAGVRSGTSAIANAAQTSATAGKAAVIGAGESVAKAGTGVLGTLAKAKKVGVNVFKNKSASGGVLKGLYKGAGGVAAVLSGGKIHWSSLQPGMIELESKLDEVLFAGQMPAKKNTTFPFKKKAAC